MRVSRWVNALLLPHLYQTVLIRTEAQSNNYLETISHRPELCQFLSSFDCPNVKPLSSPNDRWQIKSDSITANMGSSNDSVGPKPRVVAYILFILLEETVLKRNEETTRVPKALHLESATIHSSTLYMGSVPSYARYRPNVVMPRSLTITGRISINFGYSKWNFFNMEKLRFT